VQSATKLRLSLSAIVWATLVGGCIQQLDTAAIAGSPAPTQTSNQALTSWQLCQSPSCDEPDGYVPPLLATPVIYLPDGGTTSDPCDDIEAQSVAIRQTYCAACHASPASQGGLGFVLDDEQLAGAYSQTAVLPDGGPQRLLIPGDPNDSRLYQRAAAGLSGSTAGMPPLALPGYPAIPRPSVADVSVLYGWIVACVADGGGVGYTNGGGDYSPGIDDGGSAGVGVDDGG
jgi:hypothetical protein